MILMYHHVAPQEAVPSDSVRRRAEGWNFHVTPEGLDRHLRRLRERGFRFVSLDEVLRRLLERGREDAREVALTFDDGWSNQFEHALPVLRRNRVTATFFVPSGAVSGVSGDARMQPGRLRELAFCGMSIGGHSRTHARLAGLAPGPLKEEVSGCRRDLEDRLQAPVRHFAYPGGAFDRAAVEAVEAAGYDSACCSLGPARNRAGDRFHLFRVWLTDSACTWRDRIRSSPAMWWILRGRVSRQLERRLR